MIKYEIGYPLLAGTGKVGTTEDYEKGRCDMEFWDSSKTYRNALKKAVMFLREHPDSFVMIQDYDTVYDCASDVCDIIHVKDVVVMKDGDKLNQEWQDLFNKPLRKGGKKQ